MRTYVTLDGLRGVAALSIVVLHCHRYIGDIGRPAAALAVDLFFVLSGFVLAYAYEHRLPNGAGDFLKARFIRLYPLYLAGTLLGVVEALLILRTGQGSVDWTWTKFWVALPFSAVMLPGPAKSMFPFDGVMWSIFFELFANILWAIFWKPLRSTRVLVAVVIFGAIGLAASAFYSNTFVGLGQNWTAFVGGAFRVIYSFFLGILLFRFHKKWRLPKLPPLLLIAALPAILFLPLPLYAQLFAALFVLPWFVLLGSQVEPSGILELISRKLGLASYAVYAIHKRVYLLSYAFVLQILRVDLQNFAPWIGILFILVLVPGCLLLNKIYDEPARRWLTERFGGKSLKTAVSREQATQAP